MEYRSSLSRILTPYDPAQSFFNSLLNGPQPARRVRGPIRPSAFGGGIADAVPMNDDGELLRRQDRG